ncbi:MAG: hypothetical protein ONB31_08600 [candidate division KSB1 bacterium]|nr:hypothetical protein [candidate division KSB1 bacterium]MDZ7336391.1 hypothetical protein [candidate division KSB1 bacterium]MDZ7357410.1 hypothetical protein [candidate division KSB1 bacterium]MDZ7401692.1 hypothetical protein [candidate division KSB1 bacterium]
MTVQGWIVFAIGILFILVGGGLMVYSSLSRRQAARASTVDQGILEKILNFVLKVLEIIVKLIPQNIIAQVGFILIILGIALVVLPFLIPGL